MSGSKKVAGPQAGRRLPRHDYTAAMDTRYDSLGFIRCAAHSPQLELADPLTNAERILALLRRDAGRQVSISLFPELALTGYSVEDLFHHRTLRDRSHAALARLARGAADLPLAFVVGAPWTTPDGRPLNCAFVIGQGRVLGAVPKQHLPNYGEFYEHRWFVSGTGIALDIDDVALGRFHLGARQLFAVGDVRFAIEICEDLWAPAPPGTEHALAGADIILNPSASNELVAKADYRRDLVRMTSAQRVCGYLYAGASANESTKDIVFGGHLIAAENGAVLGEGERFGFAGSELMAEFDVEHLRRERMQFTTFATAARPAAYPVTAAAARVPLTALARGLSAQPFVPADEHLLAARAEEILAIQSTGLARRLRAVRSTRMVIGLSGGLDSTLALLVCLEAAARLGGTPAAIHAVTMPGPATSSHTLSSARTLAKTAGVELREVDIRAAVTQHFSDIGHDATVYDITFENTQARERTQVLFDIANQQGGIVVGTGDLSELALGWCTYNADHMASYNVNASVPKTLIAYLVRWYARHRAPPPLADVLQRVLDTPISPELVPGRDDVIAQKTEDLVGPYRLHDFFLFHFLRHGSGPTKIDALAALAFAGEFDRATIRHWLRVFCTRFFSQQFKRTTLPPGPKVGSVSLSPRGDWRMPDEASNAAWLAELDALTY